MALTGEGLRLAVDKYVLMMMMMHIVARDRAPIKNYSAFHRRIYKKHQKVPPNLNTTSTPACEILVDHPLSKIQPSFLKLCISSLMLLRLQSGSH